MHRRRSVFEKSANLDQSKGCARRLTRCAASLVMLGGLFSTLFALGQTKQNAQVQKTQKEHNVIYFFVAPDSSFSATGKWVSTSSDPGDQIVYPQEVEIDCFKEGWCIEATAEYYMGNPHITVAYLDIIRRDKNGIVAETSSGICMTDTILISFADQTISATYLPKKLDDPTKEACAFFGAKQSQSFVFVLKGSDRWNKEHWKGILPNK
jgi:hypothetical protein